MENDARRLRAREAAIRCGVPKCAMKRVLLFPLPCVSQRTAIRYRFLNSCQQQHAP